MFASYCFIDLFALIFASYSLYCRHHDQQTHLQIDNKKKKVNQCQWCKICYYEQLCSSHAPVDSQVHLSDSVMNENLNVTSTFMWLIEACVV